MLAFSVPPGYRRSEPPARPKLDRFIGIIDLQVDFGEALAVIAGVERKIHFLAMDLAHSDACLVQAYPAESSESFFRRAPRRLRVLRRRAALDPIRQH